MRGNVKYYKIFIKLCTLKNIAPFTQKAQFDLERLIHGFSV